MSFCSQCGMPVDECNESQPVCPCCGEDRVFSQYGFGRLDLNGLATSSERLSTTSPMSPMIETYNKNPRGIRLQAELHRVCVRCGAQGNGRSFVRCTNPECNEAWRVNHCGKCKQAVDSRDPETPRCANCGWLKCAACNSCNCGS